MILSYEVRFSTYAVPMIAGEIRRFLRDDSMLKVSRSLKELAVKAAKLREKLCMEQGEEPGLPELARQLGVEPEELVLACDSCSEVESLHKIIYQGDGEGGKPHGACGGEAGRAGGAADRYAGAGASGYTGAEGAAADPAPVLLMIRLRPRWPGSLG